jgi:CobQ/CobB/MinD/ParA nucleotide binding domain
MLASKQMQAHGASNADATATTNLSGERAARAVAGSREQSMQIVIAIGKGGRGKSTTLANLATPAASLGLSVGVIDADPQASLCQWRGTRGNSIIKVVPCGDGDVLAAKVETARKAGIQWLFVDTAPPRREGMESPLVRQARDSLRQAGGRAWVGQITHRHSIIQALIDGRGVIEVEPEGPAAVEFAGLWAAINNHASRMRHRRQS